MVSIDVVVCILSKAFRHRPTSFKTLGLYSVHSLCSFDFFNDRTIH